MRQAVLDHGNFMPPAYELADVTAVQALSRGQANPEQQRRAFEWIVRKACATYDFPYRPGGADGERDTLIGLGRQFVGQQIVKLLHLNTSGLKRDEPRGKPDREQP